MQQAIDALPLNQRIVITLRDVEGLPAAEVYNALAISETSQRALLHRARSKVSGQLEHQLEGGRVETATDGYLDCRQFVEIVSDYLEGALSEAERQRFDAHLESCEGCRRYLDQMRTTIRVVGTLNEEDLDPGAKEQLLQLIYARKRT
ncbi:MAG TPA: zf-HC2 domain-containing protein [Gemmatimonadales bacterium]